MSRYSKNNQTSFQKYTRLYCFQTSVMSIYFLKENIFKNLLKRYICRKKRIPNKDCDPDRKGMLPNKNYHE